jgi:hypothetical protein
MQLHIHCRDRRFHAAAISLHRRTSVATPVTLLPARTFLTGVLPLWCSWMPPRGHHLQGQHECTLFLRPFVDVLLWRSYGHRTRTSDIDNLLWKLR